jgi:small GTP-binding protein
METLRIAVLGSRAVGKTSVILRLVQDIFLSNYQPTVQNLFEKSILHNRTWFNLVIIDTAGQDELESVTDLAIKSASAFVMMYSCVSRESFQELERIRARVDQVSSQAKPKIVVVGNKCDLTAERTVSEAEGQSWAASIGAPWLECSAKTNVNIEPIFLKILELVTGVAAKERRGSARKAVQNEKSCCNVQ